MHQSTIRRYTLLLGLVLFSTYWLTSGMLSYLCALTATVIPFVAIRFPLRWVPLLGAFSDLVLSFTLSPFLALFLTIFGLYDRELGQDYISFYVWDCFLVGVPGLITWLILNKMRPRE